MWTVFPVGPPSAPNYECWWGYGTMPKLMTGNPAVRAYLFAVTRKWMALGIDGWRLDVANEVPHDFWIAWRSLVKSINPDAYLCAEIWDNAAPWLKGDEFDGTMNYRFRTVAHRLFQRTYPPCVSPGLHSGCTAGRLQPGSESRPVEPSRESRYRAHPDTVWRRHRVRPAGGSLSDDISRRTHDLLWGRDRNERRKGSRIAAGPWYGRPGDRTRRCSPFSAR